MQIELDAALRGRIADRAFFHEFVRAMFFHRRKFLRSQLLAACKDRLDKGGVDRILAELGLDRTDRAENLDIDTMLALCERREGGMKNMEGKGDQVLGLGSWVLGLGS